MQDKRDEWLDEIKEHIRLRKRVEHCYRFLHIALMTTIAGCGFLTAAASQVSTADTWVSNPNVLLILGLMTAICAILNQVVNPVEKSRFHKSIRKSLGFVRGALEFRGISLSEAEKMRAIAVVSPELILGRMHDDANLSTGEN